MTYTIEEIQVAVPSTMNSSREKEVGILLRHLDGVESAAIVSGTLTLSFDPEIISDHDIWQLLWKLGF